MRKGQCLKIMTNNSNNLLLAVVENNLINKWRNCTWLKAKAMLVEQGGKEHNIIPTKNMIEKIKLNLSLLKMLKQKKS